MTDQPFEDDTRNPFKADDEMPKPKPGDLLTPNRFMESTQGMPAVVKVIVVHDTLGESWDPTGEAAWQQHDVNDMMGFKGRWYAICEDVRISHEGDEWVLASYEVAAIAHQD